MMTEIAGVVAAIAAPLISKEEHLLGEKALTLALKWGEPVVVKIKAIGWKQLRRIAGENLPHHEHVETIMRESLSGSELNLDHLDSISLANLTTHCLAFSLGESAIAKKIVPAAETLQTTPAGSKDAGEQVSNLSGTDTPPMKLMGGAQPG